MKKLQCQDADCRGIFDEDKVLEWDTYSPVLKRTITLVKCPKCRGKLKEYSEGNGTKSDIRSQT